MPKLRLLTSLSGVDVTYGKGDEVEFDDADEAQRLIDAGFAEPIDNAAADTSKAKSKN